MILVDKSNFANDVRILILRATISGNNKNGEKQQVYSVGIGKLLLRASRLHLTTM